MMKGGSERTFGGLIFLYRHTRTYTGWTQWDVVNKEAIKQRHNKLSVSHWLQTFISIVLQAPVQFSRSYSQHLWMAKLS